MIIELDHTLNEDFLYNFKAAGLRNEESVSLDIKDDGLIMNKDTVISAFPKLALSVSSSSQYVSITEKDFEEQPNFDGSYKYTFHFPIISAVSSNYKTARQSLKTRVEDRARYFQLIDIVHRKRNNDTSRQPLSYFLEKEQALLTKSMQEAIDSEFDLKKDKPFKVYFNYRLPGFEISSSQFSYDVETYQKR